MLNELAPVTDRINALLDQIERGDAPKRASLEETLTDGYACALSLDAECVRIERRISENAAELSGSSGAEWARELSALARLLAHRRRELDALRGLLTVLRTGVQQARVA
jgi:hypothetical protein